MTLDTGHELRGQCLHSNKLINESIIHGAIEKGRKILLKNNKLSS